MKIMRDKAYIIGMVMIILLLAVLDAPAMAVIKIMPLGDSITVGNQAGAVPDNNDYYIAYRLTLWNKLVAAGYDAAGLEFVGSLQSGSLTSLPDPDHEGHIGEETEYIESNVYSQLVANPAKIILLHIGTNDILAVDDADLTVAVVSRILDEIDRYETDNSVDITVILALIINQWNTTCGNPSATSDFNDKLYNMAWDRINNPVNPAYPDKIEIVDMECGAGINYLPQASGGDMFTNVHPNNNGFTKMADVWYTAIFAVTHPTADAGSDQDVNEFELVTLHGSNSSDPDGPIASYQWSQTQGSAVVLSGSGSATPTFTAPDIASGEETLTFQLTVTDDDGLQDTDIVVITVHNPSSTGGDGGGGGGCFVATAANGSLMEPHVKILREFRDRCLLTNRVGKGLVNLYYTYSQSLADYIAKREMLRAVVRLSLLPLVGMGWLAVHFGPAISVTLLVIIVLIAVQAIRKLLFFKRRRALKPNPLHTGV